MCELEKRLVLQAVQLHFNTKQPLKYNLSLKVCTLYISAGPSCYGEEIDIIFIAVRGWAGRLGGVLANLPPLSPLQVVIAGANLFKLVIVIIVESLEGIGRGLVELGWYFVICVTVACPEEP